jgi:hypothetical protein
MKKFIWAVTLIAAYFVFNRAISGWEYAHLLGPSIPMGAGIAADVFAVTLVNATLFPEEFKKWWVWWVVAVGGSHAVLPIFGQVLVIYLEPLLLTMGVPVLWLEIAKTLATVAGCWFLWVFLKGVFEDGVLGKTVDVFVALTVMAVWGCSADAAYSGAVKAAPAIQYMWTFAEIVVSNIIAATVVMVTAIVAVVLGLGLGHKMRKPKYQIGAFYIEFSVLGYFLIFFALTRLAGLYKWQSGEVVQLPLELISIVAASGFVGWLFWKNRTEIVEAQQARLGLS